PALDALGRDVPTLDLEPRARRPDGGGSDDLRGIGRPARLPRRAAAGGARARRLSGDGARGGGGLRRGRGGTGGRALPPSGLTALVADVAREQLGNGLLGRLALV